MDVLSIIKRFNSVKSERDSYWLKTWQQIRKYCMPEALDYNTEGAVAGGDIYDCTAVYARERLASGMYSWMLDPAKKLIELKAESSELNEFDDVQQFFAELTRRVIEEIANSNYTAPVLEMLNNCACGIDGVVFVEDVKGKVSFRSIPIEDVCYLESAAGEVDTIFRELELSSRQCVQFFDQESDRLPDYIKSEAANEKADKKHRILQAVFPRIHKKSDPESNKDFPFADYYIDLKTKTLIREGGFREFPFLVCRFVKLAKERYGRGPGLKMLPDIKMVNRMRQAYILGLERVTNPETLLPEGVLVDDEWNRDPGATHTYNPGMFGAKPEFMSYPIQLQFLAGDIQAERQMIKEGFFLDIFDPLGDLKNISATEATIRNDGKLVPFAPIVGNVHRDFLAPLVQRIVGIIVRRGEFPEVPQRILDNDQNWNYKIEFVSKIALAIKQLDAANWVRFEGIVQGVCQVHPETLDNLDADRMFRDLARGQGIDPAWLKSEDDVKYLRQQREKMQMQQRQLQNLSGIASTLPALSNEIEPNSILSSLQG